jgi:hypothetical protein
MEIKYNGRETIQHYLQEQRFNAVPHFTVAVEFSTIDGLYN